MRIAVVGKGGAGKSVIAGTIARILAGRGRAVLALDSDLMPGLATSIGMAEAIEPPLLQAAEVNEQGRWRLKKGIGPVRAVERYTLEGPDGIRLLQCGKITTEGLRPILAAVNAYYQVIHRLSRAQFFHDWTFVGDLPAGPRQTAFDWAPYARTLLLVVEPTWKSALTARRVARIARSRPGVDVVAIANKVSSDADSARVARLLGEPVVTAFPVDEAIGDAERLGIAPVDHPPAAEFVARVRRLVDGLAAE